MRCRALLVIPLLLFAGSAHGGVLTSATWLQVLHASVVNQPFAGIPMTRTTGQLGATGLSTGVSIAVSLFYPAFTTTVFVPKTANGVVDFAVQVTQGGPQAITATANGGNGVPGVPGSVVLKNAVHNAMGVNASMFMLGAITLLQIPLSHGNTGQFTNTFTVLGALHSITVDFYAWTPGTRTFKGLSTLVRMGAVTSKAPLPDVVAMGSFNLTSHGGGMVTLVSPSKISVDGALVGRRTVSVTTLTLSFVPEPGTLLLLGAAALALGLVVRRT